MATKQILWAALCIAALTGCSKENDTDRGPRMISFDVQQRVQQYTRADYIEKDTFAMNDRIGVLGYALPTGSWTGSETPALMYNSELTKIASKTFRYNPMVPWPSTGKVCFFAYYPYSASVTEGIITPSPLTQSGYPSVTVVLGKSEEPIDFMTGTIAATDYATSGGTINFRFNHRLSKLLFKAKAPKLVKDTLLYINSLRIRNVYNKATYNFSKETWSDPGNESTTDAVSGATLKFNSATQAVGSADYTDLLAASKNEAYILMLPQTYPNTELEIGYTLEFLKSAGGCEYHVVGTKTFPIAVDWEMGKVYIYRFEFTLSEVSGIDVKVKVMRETSDSEWKEETLVDTEIN